MFGALNRFISRLDADPQGERVAQRNGYGFQVLRNNNPDIALEPWFDFIIGINGRNLDNPDGSLFAAEVRNCAGTSVEIGVWSAKGQRIRSLWISVPADSASLGISLQWQPLSASEDVWHILDVTPNSPADDAGLLPYGDYIIGSPEALMKGESGLGELLEEFIGQPMRLYVYNHEYDVTRLVTIHPSREWGGTGALGCVLGFGALHRLPSTLEEPPQAPGETLFETARLSTDIDARPTSKQSAVDAISQSKPPTDKAHILIPAEMLSPPLNKPVSHSDSKPPQQIPASRRSRPIRHTAPVVDMDDYFREGEAKSREQDYAPPSKPNEQAGPPPKTQILPPPPREASVGNQYNEPDVPPTNGALLSEQRKSDDV